MTRPALIIEAGASLGSVVKMMKNWEVRHLPVVAADKSLIGIVTDRDLRQAVFDPLIQELLGSATDKLKGLTVCDVMTWGVVTARPNMSIREAAHVMHERKIGALPVVDRGRVVGMLTERDVLSALEEILRGHVEGVRPMPPAEAGAESYDYGFPEPVWGEPWQRGRGGMTATGSCGAAQTH
jgi:acetoin utilization protein AcuB